MNDKELICQIEKVLLENGIHFTPGSVIVEEENRKERFCDVIDKENKKIKCIEVTKSCNIRFERILGIYRNQDIDTKK